jgi:hypothetical protein
MSKGSLRAWGCLVGLLFTGFPACRALSEEASKPPEKLKIPEIPKEKLPPRTRPKPDPEKTPYILQPVRVTIEEAVTSPKGDSYVPEPVTLNYLSEYFRRAGHLVVGPGASAAYGVEGRVQLQFHSDLKVLGQPMGWKYRASASFRVLDGSGKELEHIEIPEVFRESVKSDKSAVVTTQRYLAKVIWDNLFYRGSVFADKKIQGLINALAQEGGEDGAPDLGLQGPVTTGRVIQALADAGFKAVPYLLDALTDERIVRVDSEDPRLKGRNLDDFKIYHVADKALEEIFQKVSPMSLDTIAKERFVIIKGWEKEWRRFCKPYRESPSAPKEPRAEDPKKPGMVQK